MHHDFLSLELFCQLEDVDFFFLYLVKAEKNQSIIQLGRATVFERVMLFQRRNEMSEWAFKQRKGIEYSFAHGDCSSYSGLICVQTAYVFI